CRTPKPWRASSKSWLGFWTNARGRLVAAAEAEARGFGGVTAVAQASGLSRGTVIRGMAELKPAAKPARGQRIRRKGAGRKRTVDQDATLKRDLEALVEPVTR